jgi:hypothetical protein
MTRAFQRYPICRGPLDHSGLGFGHATTQAWAMLLLAIYELQYVLQYIVINKLFGNHKLILVFLFLFSVALAQNTTGITTATTMTATGGNGPLAPHMRPCAPCQHVKWMGDNPPSLWMYSLGGLRVFMALKALLCSGDDESPLCDLGGAYAPANTVDYAFSQPFESAKKLTVCFIRKSLLCSSPLWLHYLGKMKAL